MDKEHRVSVYDMVKELNLKEVTPEIYQHRQYVSCGHAAFFVAKQQEMTAAKRFSSCRSKTR